MATKKKVSLHPEQSFSRTPTKYDTSYTSATFHVSDGSEGYQDEADIKTISAASASFIDNDNFFTPFSSIFSFVRSKTTGQKQATKQRNVRFTEAGSTVYTKYKLKNRKHTAGKRTVNYPLTVNRLVKSDSLSVYGGYGPSPGIISTIEEITKSELKAPTTLSDKNTEIISQYSVLSHGTWKLCNVSVIKPQQKQLACSLPTFFKEVNMLAFLKHPFLIQILGVCSGPKETDVCYLTEHLYHGSLYAVLHTQNQELTIQEVVEMAHNIGSALYFLHSKHYLHTGISSKSIFVGREAKLGNLGHIQDTTREKLAPNFTYWRWSDPKTWLLEEGPTTGSDVYSLGCVIWECLNNRVPWDKFTNNNIVQTMSTIISSKKKLKEPARGGKLVKITMQMLRKEDVLLSEHLTNFSNIMEQIRTIS